MLHSVRPMLFDMQKKINRRLYKFNRTIGCEEKHPLYHYLLDEQKHYLSVMETVTNDLEAYLRADDLFSHREISWCQRVLEQRVPSNWDSNSILPLDSWLELLL